MTDGIAFIGNDTGFIGEADDWEHDLTVAAPDSGGNDHDFTPTGGVVRISYLDANEVRRYWNGTAFTLTYTELATTIVGRVSRYPYVHQAETKDRIVLFEGWMTRNGAKTPLAWRERRVKAPFSTGDSEVDPFQPA